MPPQNSNILLTEVKPNPGVPIRGDSSFGDALDLGTSAKMHQVGQCGNTVC